MGWLEGQVALVTGGGSGLGAAIVERFVEEGARVGVLEIVPAKCDALRERFGASVVVTEGDAVEWDANERAVAATVDAFGGLDSLITCAGIWDYHTTLEQM